MLVPVAPLLQTTIPAHPVAVKVAVSLLHKLVLLALTVGGFVPLPVVMMTAFDAPLSPQLLLHIAV